MRTQWGSVYKKVEHVAKFSCGAQIVNHKNSFCGAVQKLREESSSCSVFFPISRGYELQLKWYTIFVNL